MFFGVDYHTTDAKGRIFIPVRHRKHLSGSFYVMHETDKCVRIYTESGWASFRDKLAALPRSADKLRRLIYQNVFECELDSSGRLLIPDSLRKYAGINKDVTVIGVDDRLELWDTATYDDYMKDMTDQTAEEEIEKYLS